MGARELTQHVEAVRRFNRFYTRQIGVLQEGLLGSSFSLAEARVLYELAHQDGPTASELRGALGIDPGYLSRILRGFRRRGLVDQRAAAGDGRRRHLSLTRSGRAAFAPLDRRTHDEIAAVLRRLSPGDQRRLIDGMRDIETLVAAGPRDRAPYLLRPPRPGDLGWVIHRHGAVYAREYGYDEGFEALVARVVAAYVEELDPRRDRCWIAEVDGANAGSIFLVKKSRTIGQLRLLLVEPEARGLGIGGRLVAECVRTARQLGYRALTLWTQSELLAARRLYRQAGFRLVARERHRSFGRDLVGETWELAL